MNYLGIQAMQDLMVALEAELASDDVQVSYAFPAAPLRIVIFGGGVRSARSDVVAEPGLVIQENVTIDLYVRGYSPGDDAAGIDLAVGEQVDAICAWVRGNPFFEGLLSNLAVTATVRDPVINAAAPEPAVLSICMVQLTCGGKI